MDNMADIIEIERNTIQMTLGLLVTLLMLDTKCLD